MSTIESLRDYAERIYRVGGADADWGREILDLLDTADDHETLNETLNEYVGDLEHDAEQAGFATVKDAITCAGGVKSAMEKADDLLIPAMDAGDRIEFLAREADLIRTVLCEYGLIDESLAGSGRADIPGAIETLADGCGLTRD